jgi:hypothetical protein
VMAIIGISLVRIFVSSSFLLEQRTSIVSGALKKVIGRQPHNLEMPESSG